MNRKVGFVMLLLLLLMVSVGCGERNSDLPVTPTDITTRPQETVVVSEDNDNNFINTSITNNTSSLIVSQVTDPESDIGIVVTESSQQEMLLISGEKDAQGQLRSITTMRLSSLTEEDKWVELQFNSDKLPDSVIFPDGIVAKLSNYTDTSVDISFYYSIDQIYPTITQEVDIQKVRALQKRLQQDNIYTYGRNVLPLPVNSTHQVNRPVVQRLVTYGNDMQAAIEIQDYRRYENLSCEELKILDNLVWLAGQTFSVIMCGLSVAADVASIGLATPLTIWACSSVVVSGISKIKQVLDQDNKPSTQAICHADNLNSWANLGASCIKTPTGASCLGGAGKLLYDLWRQNACQNSDCDPTPPRAGSCSELEALCQQWGWQFRNASIGQYECECLTGDGAFCGESERSMQDMCSASGFAPDCFAGTVFCRAPAAPQDDSPADDSPADDSANPPTPPDDPAPPPEPPAGGDDSPALDTEDFDGSRLDSSKWAQTNSAGEITMDNGVLRMGSSASQYPYIYRSQNPFPATGNFEMVARFRYSEVNDCGVGILMSTSQVPVGLSQEEAAKFQEEAEQNGMSAGVWQDLANGLQVWYRAGADRFDGQLGGPDTLWHEMKIEYVANRYQIYLDDSLVYTSDETTFRPQTIWMGHPANLGSPCLWSTLEVDSITVRALP